MNLRHALYPALAALCLACAAGARADTVTVNTVSALQSAINAAPPGRTILVVNGTYNFGSRITITRQGTAAQPIVIAAQTVGGVTIQGGGGFAMGSPAAYVTVRGFVFTHQAGTTTLAVGTRFCRFTRNVFEMRGSTYLAYLSIGGDDHQIDYNLFQNKNFVGQMIRVDGPGSSGMAQRTWIHHNHFRNFPNCGANNCSAIQVGLSSRSLSPAHTLVEHNLFSNTRGENENIANKASDNIYRFNTFADRSSELSLRHGNRMQVYGNYFVNTDGLRIFGDDHRIHSNYFERCTPAIHLGNGGTNIPPGELTGHDRPDSVRIVYNTLVNNPTNFTMSSRSGGLGALRPFIANNIIQGGGTALNFSGPVTNPTYEGNIVWGTSAGQLPAGGHTVLNPQLAADARGVYRLQAGSPAIGRGTGNYPWVTVDMDGQSRGAARDAGADQFSTAPVAARMLTPADVGPGAAGSTALAPAARRRAFSVEGGFFDLAGRRLSTGMADGGRSISVLFPERPGAGRRGE